LLFDISKIKDLIIWNIEVKQAASGDVIKIKDLTFRAEDLQPR
jgi:hypothetical protein